MFEWYVVVVELLSADEPVERIDNEDRVIEVVQRAQMREAFFPICEGLVLPLVSGFETIHVTWRIVQRVEFTIEPFVEGRPGPHVNAPTDLLRSLGVEVEVGPFGSSCDVDDGRVGEIVGAITHAAIANGATHVNIDVSTEPGS